MLRYSLGSLMLILVYASLACAALVNASGIWPQLIVTMTGAILLLFTLKAAIRQGASHHFALGFSITGWVYFLRIFTSVLNVRNFLLTETSVQYLFATIHSEQLTSGVPLAYATLSQTPTGRS